MWAISTHHVEMQWEYAEGKLNWNKQEKRVKEGKKGEKSSIMSCAYHSHKELNIRQNQTRKIVNLSKIKEN